MKDFIINLGPEHEELVPSMEFIKQVREELDSFKDLALISVFKNGIDRFRLSSCIYGFLFELQAECKKRGIVFVIHE